MQRVRAVTSLDMADHGTLLDPSEDHIRQTSDIGQPWIHVSLVDDQDQEITEDIYALSEVCLPEQEKEDTDVSRIETVSSVTDTDTDAFSNGIITYRDTSADQVYCADTSLIEERISIDTLQTLKSAFEHADVDGTGKLELSEFKSLLKAHLNIPSGKNYGYPRHYRRRRNRSPPGKATVDMDAQIDALFQKIDWSSEGAITWDEFCTYMQLEYAEKEDSYLRAKEVAFHLPAKIHNMPHREPILRITDMDGTFMACSQDGLVTFWSSNTDLKRSKQVQASSSKTKWITDFVIMSQYNKIIVGTGDREIQFFELSSFEPYCQINSLETVPLKLDYCSTGHDECIVLFGDSHGCINIIVISSAGECLRTWKKCPKADGIASIGIDQIASTQNTRFIRWQVHSDWVQQVKYFHDIRQVISCSNDSNSALVIGCTTGSTHVEQQLREIREPTANNADRSKQRALTSGWAQPKHRLATDQSVFKVYKGVKCFAFSKDKNIIVTGGMDRIVRMWNPYVAGKPTGMLRGHNAPIFYLFIAEDENRIFSISTDKCIKIWDIQDQNCLLTVRPKSHKIRGDLQACHYSNIAKTLAVATDQMNGLPLRLKAIQHADIPITHKEPVHCVVYNPSFKQVITCSEGSVIKLWDVETGKSIFEFGEAHGEEAITCVTFDNTGRRLITGGRDGGIRLWNYNNGHCLKTMTKERDNEEICALQYVEMNRNRYVIAVGWDKRINIYSDSSDDTVRQLVHPVPNWADDLANGHVEDVLSVTQCPPNLLATSSYDGEVIIWNLISGHIFCHLRAEKPPDYEDFNLDGDMSVNKVLFLKTRANNKDAGTLVASGPRSHIHLWRVFDGGCLMAQFPATKLPGAMITSMEVNKANTTLFTADSFGFLCVWNIEGYCMSDAESEPPELVVTWRGHVENVTSLSLVEEQKLLLSSSLDCTVRMWNYDGEYVGTLGQPDDWNIYNKTTFQHPMVPYDVLVDPLSLPDHPVLADKRNTHQVVHEDSTRNSADEEEEEDRAPTPTLQYTRQTNHMDDEQISHMLKDKPFNKGTGKRLRHEKTRPLRVDRGGPSEYQYLQCYDPEPTPRPQSPTHLRRNKGNLLDFYAEDIVEEED